MKEVKITVTLKTLKRRGSDGNADCCKICALSCKHAQPKKGTDFYCGDRGYWTLEKAQP